MYFILFDDGSIESFEKMGAAARAVISRFGLSISSTDDPVRIANEAMKGKGIIVNLSTALDKIAKSRDGDAQILAKRMKVAIDFMYENK